MSTTASIACQQFEVPGAGETIQAVSELSDVFSPPHHGPVSIPITVQLENSDSSYTHFPIVRTARYAIYLDTPDVFAGLIYPGSNQNTGTGTSIATEITTIGSCSSFVEGFVSTTDIIFSRDDPQPIAIQFNNCNRQTIKYIVAVFID